MLGGLKIIFGYVGVYRRELIILSILGVLDALSAAVSPYLLGRFFDAVLRPNEFFVIFGLSLSIWAWLLILWAAVQIITTVIEVGRAFVSGKVNDSVYIDYSLHYFQILLALPLSFHKGSKTGEVMSRLDRAANQIPALFGDVLSELPPQLLGIIFGLGFAFYVNWQLALILLVGAASYAIALVWIVAPAADLQKKSQKFFARATGYSFDAVSNVQTVKQAVAERYERGNLAQMLGYAMRFSRGRRLVWVKSTAARSITILLTQLGIFIISAFFLARGMITIGELIMFNSYANAFFHPLRYLGISWQKIRNGFATIELAEELLHTPAEVYVQDGAVILPKLQGNIVFKDAIFSYKQKENKILDGMSFTINSGEKVALVGGSGEGKSTIADLVCGFWFAQKGKVLIDGHDVRNLDLKFLRSQIAVVSQEVMLFNDTIKHNIAYGSFSATDEEIKRAAHEAYADEFIEAFPKKYDQLVGERGVKLSGGQKQRIAIARAILRNPKILILDEPTSALDAKSENFIKDSLEKLMKGRTTIIIAHRLSTVRKADKILVLKGGQIVEQGKHDELVKIPNGVYRELYELQVGLHE